MSAIFFTLAVFVVYTYVGYPLLIALLARLRGSPWMQHPIELSASVILPVHNGMALLPAKIECLLQMDANLIRELIVVLDGRDDEAKRWLDRVDDARLKVVVLTTQLGKSAALRHGMEAATSDLLLFVDVRPTVTENAIRQLFTNFADPQVGCVAGELLVETFSNGETSAVGGLYWRYEQWIRNSESAYHSPVGVYGGFYAVRRELATLPNDGLILDDMFQPLWIIRQGYRSVVDRRAIVVDQWPATNAGEFQRKVRTLAGNFQLCANEPWLLTHKNPVLLQLISHKLFRLVVPYCLLGMLLSSMLLAAHSRAWLAIVVIQAGTMLLALLGNRVSLPLLRKLALAANAFYLLNAAAVWALWTYISTPEPLWKIWKPTASPVHGSRVAG